MQGLVLLAALFVAAEPPAKAAEEPDAPPPAAAADARPPADISKAVDANGVPAWAKRKHKQPVQSCETKPNIGIETWREKYDGSGKDRLKPKPPANVCH
jgi:hypothetical protein